MANVEKIRFTQNEPFIERIISLFEEKFDFSKTDRILNIIEIGCGPGDFTLILKDKLKDRVQITAIDPSNDIEQAKAKCIENEVDFQQSDIFKFTSEKKFDLVLFTKSLHHCIPVDQAVKNAYDLLSEDGIFFAEEVYVDKMNTNDITWFFERVDLLSVAGHMKTLDEIVKHTSFNKDKLARMLDINKPIEDRWFRPHIHNSAEHNHVPNHAHEHKHEHNHDHKHHEHKDTIVGSSAVVKAIISQFGEQKLKFNDVPYFYQFLVFFGLKDTDANTAVLKEFYKQETRAIHNKVISPLGIYIIGHK